MTRSAPNMESAPKQMGVKMGVNEGWNRIQAGVLHDRSAV